MAETKKTTKKKVVKKTEEVKRKAVSGTPSKMETKVTALSVECKDRLCPKHGDKKLKMRGRMFEGTVIKKLPGRVTIQFERMLKVPKYERYEKRKTKIHARLPDCMKDDLDMGDLIQISETRPISKMIHFVVSKVIRRVGE